MGKWALCSLSLLLLVSSALAQTRSNTKPLHVAETGNENGDTISVDGHSSLAAQVTITGSATVSFQGTQDQTNWVAVACIEVGDTGYTSITSVTATKTVRCNVAGLVSFRAVISGNSGSVDVTATASPAVMGSGSGGAGGGSGTATAITGSGTLPAEPCTINQVYGETVGGVATFYFCADGTWTAVNGASTPTMGQTADAGRVIGNAVSSATGVDIGSTVANEYVSIYRDSVLGPRVTCKIAGVTDGCNKGFLLKDGFNFIIQDESGNNLLNFEPNAADSNTQYGLGAKPAKLTFGVPLNPRGAATGGYESIVTDQPNDYYLTVTDANTDAADFTFLVSNRMAGATTATFRLAGVSKNATPSGNIDFDCAMSTFTPGTDTYTAHVTTGEVTALLTPATRSRPVAVTTASHTINGGPLVAGDIVKGSCEVDAGATTSAQMTDFRLEGYVWVTLDMNSLSD